MKANQYKAYEARAEIAKALAHPSRLYLLDLLKAKERCVCDLTDLVGADQSTVSKHLAILRHAGLIEVRKEGPKSIFRLNCACLDGFFACIETVLKSRIKAQHLTLA